MRALAIVGLLAATAGAEPMKAVVARFGDVTRVLPHGRLMMVSRQRVLVLTEDVLECDSTQFMPKTDYSIIVVFARNSDDIQFVAFKSKTVNTMGRGSVGLIATRDRASLGTIDVSSSTPDRTAEAHGAFDLVVCPEPVGK
jgi:hypothetical protein